MQDLNKLTRDEVEYILHVIGDCINIDQVPIAWDINEKLTAYHAHRIKMANPDGWGGWGGSDPSWINKSVGGGGASMGVKMELAEGEKMPETIKVTVGCGTGGGSDHPMNKEGGQGAMVSPFDVKIKYIDDKKD